jgi:pimeloyl-ACP methyl ester carboxylesterase
MGRGTRARWWAVTAAALCWNFAAASHQEAAAASPIAWHACPAPAQGSAVTDGLACATFDVPVDHAKPDGPAFRLALIRQPAQDPARRIGTLFWNPGGPGDAGTEYLPASIGGFPKQVRDRFDIISWDPRGMGGRTTPVIQCFDSAAEEQAFLSARMQELPVTAEQFAADAAARLDLNSRCVRHAGDLLAHVSTADNARDLDLLREAVGEERLSYYGTSYGTLLGATYINMFPHRVRAAILDGAVAPSAWAGGPDGDTGVSTFVRLGSDFGARDTITAFMDQCGAVDAKACPFSAGSPAATRDKWSTLLARTRGGVVVDGETLNDRALLSDVASSIYLVEPLPGFARFPGWLAVAGMLQDAWDASGKPAAPPASSAPPAERTTGGQSPPEAYVTSVGRQLAVICGESPNPQTAEAVRTQAEDSYRRAGPSPWPFIASCLGWTARAAAPYSGPWDKPTPVPVLVIGNTYDPATAFPSSVRMAQELANARLLTVHGFGHTALLNPSACAKEAMAAYLIEGRLPALGATCAQDRPPFPGG